jgi:hypothetical protein
MGLAEIATKAKGHFRMCRLGRASPRDDDMDEDLSEK